MLVEKPLLETAEGRRIDAATVRRFEGELSEEELEVLTTRLSESQELANELRACFLFGYGSQPTALYRELAQREGAELLWHANFGPWWLTPLKWMAASHGGLFEVTDPKVAAELFVRLSRKAMVELYSIPRELSQPVDEHVYFHTWRSRIDSVVDSDPGYFCFGVDGDNPDVPSGILGWCAFGERCPAELRASCSNIRSTHQAASR